MKKIYFLSGIARSGSTLLGSILNQHHQIHVTPTSPILDLICILDQTFNSLQTQYSFDKDTVSTNVISATLESSYKNIKKSIVFDKHRGWPKNLKVAQSYLPYEFKGIVTHRPIPELITSFLKLMQHDPNNFIDNHLRADRRPINTRNRADYLWRYYALDPYNSALYGIQNHRDKLLALSYDDIVLDTANTLTRIEKFFDIDGVSDLQLAAIENTCAESKDEAWGLKNLHTIRERVEKTSDSAIEVLGTELFDYYSQFNLSP